MQLSNSAEIEENPHKETYYVKEETQKEGFCLSWTCFKWCKRFEECVDLILDGTGRGLKLDVTCTEKMLTLISDLLDEGRLHVLKFYT